MASISRTVTTLLTSTLFLMTSSVQGDTTQSYDVDRLRLYARLGEQLRAEMKTLILTLQERYADVNNVSK